MIFIDYKENSNMKLYKNHEKRKKELLDYLQKNPEATHRQIKKNTKIKVERVFLRGMKEAYEKAGIPFSKPLLKRDRRQQMREVLGYIRNNLGCSLFEIQKKTGINIPRLLSKVGLTYKKKKINCPRKKEEIRGEIINLIKMDPLLTCLEIDKKLGIDIHKYFKNMEEIYKRAGVEYIEGHKKCLIKKRIEVINYLKDNILATQWEINKNCHTHIQEIFKGGIREAYTKANIKYPEERRKIYGAAKKEVKDRALKFEDEMIEILSRFGNIKKYFRIKNLVADAILKMNNKNYIVEIKDYRSKPITFSEVKQLNNYIENTPNCNDGLLVCRYKGKKDKFYIGQNEIFIITKEDLLKGGVV